jgi:hypothetical protein
VEGFDAAPVVRFYGADVATAQPPPAEPTPGQPAPEHVAEPARHVARPQPLRAAAPLVALAVLAGLGAVALATWAFVSAVRAADDASRAAPARPTVVRRADPGLGRALALLARPSTQRFQVAGSLGRIVLAVTPGDRGFLVLRGLGRAATGRVYEAWVIPSSGRSIHRGASFSGKTALVPLRSRIHEGAAVAITLEHAGSGATGPSRTPRLVAVRR